MVFFGAPFGRWMCGGFLGVGSLPPADNPTGEILRGILAAFGELDNFGAGKLGMLGGAGRTEWRQAFPSGAATVSTGDMARSPDFGEARAGTCKLRDAFGEFLLRGDSEKELLECDFDELLDFDELKNELFGDDLRELSTEENFPTGGDDLHAACGMPCATLSLQEAFGENEV